MSSWVLRLCLFEFQFVGDEPVGYIVLVDIADILNGFPADERLEVQPGDRKRAAG